MTEPWQQKDPPVAPEQAVGRAIQDLMATRLGRGFVPLALLAVVGLLELAWLDFTGGGGLALVLGAVAAGSAMLAFGLRISQLAFGRTQRPWMSAAMLFSLIPPGFALYVLVWRGLRFFLVGSGFSGFAAACFFTLAGGWVMRSWMSVVEMGRMMASGQDGVAGP